MDSKKIIFPAILILFSSMAGLCASEQEGEKIVYDMRPFGKAVYTDLGQKQLNGNTVNMVTFRTEVVGFDDTETIYTEPKSFLPVRVERNISMWGNKEYIIEEYLASDHTLKITKFKEKKEAEVFTFKEDGPIYNAVILPFYLRTVPDLDIGWKMTIRLPAKFEVELASIEQIKVPAGKFIAYHFTSTPNKFEIWISKDNPRLPLKIKDVGVLGYTMVLEKYTAAAGK